jgi:hypothetical protein
VLVPFRSPLIVNVASNYAYGFLYINVGANAFGGLRAR